MLGAKSRGAAFENYSYTVLLGRQTLLLRWYQHSSQCYYCISELAVHKIKHSVKEMSSELLFSKIRMVCIIYAEMLLVTF